MLSECGQNKDYIRAASSKGENYSVGSLFMLLIFQQEKMINELIAKVPNVKSYKNKHNEPCLAPAF